MSKSLPPDSLAEAIGRLSMAWSNAELAMAVLLQALLDTDAPTAVAVSVAADYSRRRDLLNSLATLKLRGQLKVDYDKIMSELNGLSKERNAVIHGIFINLDGKERRLNLNNRGVFTGVERVESVGRINAVAKKIVTITNAIPDLAVRVEVAVKAWREKVEPSTPSLRGYVERHQVTTPGKP